MPLFVYVSREKRPTQHHNFKAGALNVLLRGSAMMSNSPYILVLDCDMYCNDPTSARKAMCCHLDPDVSPSLAFALFPQTFRNVSKDDIYDSQLRHVFKIQWHGLDGLGVPVIPVQTFILRERHYWTVLVRKKALTIWHLRDRLVHPTSSLKTFVETVGFMYFSVLEDYFTGFTLHCKGWKSVYLNPPRPQFLGTATTSFNDLSIQWTRWTSGLVGVGISRFCPLIYGPLRMSLLQSMCYAELAFLPLLSGMSLWGFALIPQLCLFNGIPLYPEVSDPNFSIFLLGMREASFLPTNKVPDDEQFKLYEMGVFNFRAATMFVAPLVTVILVNIAAVIGGVYRIMVVEMDNGDHWKKLVGQIFLSVYILIMNYAVVEGIMIRKDKASIPLSVTLLSSVFSVIILSLGSFILC
ncbi:hypothetical protein PTKIN_Ptkin10aG0044000 [Pterospermum kingtungense]